MSPEGRQRLAQALLIVTPAFWATNHIVARAAAGHIAPHMLAFLRWLVALMILLPLAWPELRRLRSTWRHEWPHLLVLGALGMWICGAFVYEGGRTTSALNIGLLYATSPVMIALASAPLFGERFAGRNILGAALALAGMLYILSQGSLERLRYIEFSTGDGWIVASALAWTVYSLLLRFWPSVLSTSARLSLITLAGVLVLAPFTALEAWHAGLPTVSARTASLVLAAGLLPGFASYQAYAFMQRELGAARSGIVMYVVPLWSALIAWAMLGEAPQAWHLVGAALILPGVWLATRRLPARA